MIGQLSNRDLTGTLRRSTPNLQNVPKDQEVEMIKKVFQQRKEGLRIILPAGASVNKDSAGLLTERILALGS